MGTSSESSPVETVAIHLAPVGKRSRKTNKVTLCTTSSSALGGKRDKQRATKHKDCVGEDSRTRQDGETELDFERRRVYYTNTNDEERMDR